jgi:hypothetical protein
MRIPSLLLVASLLALPSAASALPVLSPGELSVGAELFPSALTHRNFALPSDRNVTPSTGFNIRYAFNQQFALMGTLGLGIVTIADDVEDPPVAYSVGVGGQFNVAESRYAAVLLRGGLQFIPRLDRGRQELGVRLHAGPGVEARIADPVSIQFYTALFDLQLGGDTRFDLEIVPSVAMFLYF